MGLWLSHETNNSDYTPTYGLPVSFLISVDKLWVPVLLAEEINLVEVPRPSASVQPNIDQLLVVHQQDLLPQIHLRLGVTLWPVSGLEPGQVHEARPLVIIGEVYEPTHLAQMRCHVVTALRRFIQVHFDESLEGRGIKINQFPVLNLGEETRGRLGPDQVLMSVRRRVVSAEITRVQLVGKERPVPTVCVDRLRGQREGQLGERREAEVAGLGHQPTKVGQDSLCS